MLRTACSLLGQVLARSGTAIAEDPSGPLDFVIEAEGGRRLTLVASSRWRSRSTRDGQPSEAELICGKQRTAVRVTFAPPETPMPGIDGVLASLSLEAR